MAPVGNLGTKQKWKEKEKKRKSNNNEQFYWRFATNSDIEIEFYFCPSGFPLGVTGSCTHWALWRETEEEEEEEAWAVRHFLVVCSQVAAGRRPQSSRDDNSDARSLSQKWIRHRLFKSSQWAVALKFIEVLFKACFFFNQTSWWHYCWWWKFLQSWKELFIWVKACLCRILAFAQQTH